MASADQALQHESFTDSTDSATDSGTDSETESSSDEQDLAVILLRERLLEHMADTQDIDSATRLKACKKLGHMWYEVLSWYRAHPVSFFAI